VITTTVFRQRPMLNLLSHSDEAGICYTYRCRKIAMI